MIARDLFSELELGLLSEGLELRLIRHPCKGLAVLDVPLATGPMVCHAVASRVHGHRYRIVSKDIAERFPSLLLAFPMHKELPFPRIVRVPAVTSDPLEVEEVTLVL